MPILSLQDGYIDLDSLKVARAGRFEALTRTEGRLLLYLWERQDTLVSRDELLSAVWGYRKGVRSRTLDTYLWRLRRKLEVDPAAPVLLQTEARQGVRLCPPPPPPAEGAGEAAVAAVISPGLAIRALSDPGALAAWASLRAAIVEQAAGRGLIPMGAGMPGAILLEGIAAEPALDVLLSVLSSPGAVGPLQAGLAAARWPDQGRADALSSSSARALRLAALAFPGQVVASLAVSRALPPRRMAAIGQLPLEPGAPAQPLFSPRERPPAVLPDLGVVVGRTAELAALGEALGASRLVTVVGPGGIGKHTLALSWVERALSEGRLDDVVYCALGPESAAADLAPTLARALEVRDDKLPDALSARAPSLVLLDRADGAFPAGQPQLAAWMAAAPRACFLVTACAPLGVPGERVVSLGVLPPRAAAALLLDRVAGLPGYGTLAPTDDIVAELVEAIGGAPLAIELASTRARLFPPAQLLARLRDDPLLVRTDGRPRRARLDGAVAFSWSLLRPVAREGLGRLATFPADFSMEAAEAALQGVAADAAGLVEELADASLLRLRHDADLDDIRLSLQEPVRAFALQRLAPAASTQARRQVAVWLSEASTAWRAEAEAGPDQYAALRRLRAEQHNLLAAFDAQAAAQPSVGLGLLLACLPLVDVLQTLSPALVAERLARLPPLGGAEGRSAAWLSCSLHTRLKPQPAVLPELEVLLADPALSPRQRESVRVMRVVSLALSGQLDAARPELASLRPLLAATPLPPWRLSLSVTVAVFFTQTPGGMAVAMAIAREALAAAESQQAQLAADRLRLYLAKCQASVGELDADALPGLLARCRRMAAEGARAIAQPYLLNIARAQLALQGPAAAAPTIDAVRRQAARAGDSFELSNIDRLRVEQLLLAGDFDAARETARAVIAAARAAGVRTALRQALVRLALVELCAHAPDAGLAAAAALEDAAVTAFDTFHLDCITAALHAARGDRAAARQRLTAAQPPSPQVAILCEAVSAWIEPERAPAVRAALSGDRTARATGNSGFVLRALLSGLP